MNHRSIWNDLRTVPFSQGFLDVKGVSTRYLRSGESSKPFLLLLHGVAGHAEAYVRNLAAHSEHFNTWAIDMLGHGFTDKVDHPLEVKHYVEHIVDLLDTLDIERAYVSGESLGGWVTTQLAISHPDRVERIVLNTAGGSQADPTVMARIRSLSMAAAEDPSWERVKARLEWLMADPADVNDDLIATRQAVYAQPGFVAAMDHAMALQDPTIRARNLITPSGYGSVTAPTLVLWTSHDPTADVSEGRRIASMIPQAQFVVMEGCGHWPQWEDTATFNQIHLDFLLDRA